MEYVVVINPSEPCVPIRHVIRLNESLESYDPDEFRRWYYERYCQLPDDQFIHCKSSKEVEYVCERRGRD